MKKELFKIGLIYLLILGFIFRSHFDDSATFFAMGDSSIQSVAWFAKIENSLRQGQFPLWDFNTDSGTSFIGEMQTGAFYPPAWIMALTPPYKSIIKFEFFIFLHFVWAALGVYFFLRLLKLPFLASFLGGLFFSLIGPAALRAMAQPNLHAGVVQIPWMLAATLLALEQKIGSKRLLYWSLTALFLALSILAGHMHAFIHGVLAIGILVTISSQQRLKDLLYFIAATFFSCLLAAAQLIPSTQYFKLAYKWYGEGFTAPPHIVPFKEFGRYSLKSFASLFDVSKSSSECGSLFLTYSGLLLAVLGLIYIWRNRQNKTLLFIPILITVAIVIAVSGENITGNVLHQIPFLNIVRIPLRALHLYSFGMAVLIALGANLLWNSDKSHLRIALIILITIFAYEANSYVGKYFNVAPVSHESAKNYYKETPIIQWLIKRNTEEQGQYRFATSPTSILSPNIANFYELKSLMGHRSSKQMNFFSYLERDWKHASPNYNLLALKYLVTDQERTDLKELFSAEGLKIYELPNALGMIYIERNGTREPLPAASKIHWNVNSVEIELPENFNYQNAKAYLAQPAYPSWRVKFDQQTYNLKQEDIFPYAEIPAGTKKIVFYYASLRVYIGILLSLIGFLCLGILARRGV